MLLRVVIVGILALGTAVGSARADASHLAGKYQISGVEKGEAFEGTAVIEHKQGNVVIITYNWKKVVWIGLGKLEGNNLRVTYERAVKEHDPDRMTYQVKPNGGLHYDKAGYREVWTKQK